MLPFCTASPPTPDMVTHMAMMRRSMMMSVVPRFSTMAQGTVGFAADGLSFSASEIYYVIMYDVVYNF